MINSLLGFDNWITHFINVLIPHNAIMYMFFSFFSQIGLSILIWIALLVLLIIFEERRDHTFVLYFLVSFAVTGILVNIVIKNIIKRPRPSVTSSETTCPKNYSFPSGHAAAAFSSAVIFSYFDKKRKYLYYGVAVLISLSRIYLHCHYFLDVVGGGIFGAGISYFLISIPNTYLRPKKS